MKTAIELLSEWRDQDMDFCAGTPPHIDEQNRLRRETDEWIEAHKAPPVLHQAARERIER